MVFCRVLLLILNVCFDNNTLLAVISHKYILNAGLLLIMEYYYTVVLLLLSKISQDFSKRAMNG